MHPSSIRPSPVRWIYTAVGLGLVGLGIIGYVVPGLPGTVFFVLALGAFRKCSPKLEQRLLTNRFIGPTLVAWETERRIPPRIKVVAVASMWVFGVGSIVSTFVKSGSTAISWGMAAILGPLIVYGTVYVLRQRS